MAHPVHINWASIYQHQDMMTFEEPNLEPEDIAASTNVSAASATGAAVGSSSKVSHAKWQDKSCGEWNAHALGWDI